MANKKTRAVDKEEFEKIISTIRTGFTLPNGDRVRPNERVATALTLQANLGLRIGDIVHLRLADIILEGGRYHLDIVEQKRQGILLCQQRFISTYRTTQSNRDYDLPRNCSRLQSEQSSSIFKRCVGIWGSLVSAHIHSESSLQSASI